MKTNDIAGRALNDTRMRNLQWMLLSKIKRGETLRMEGFDRSLMKLLEHRAAEIEADSTLVPESVTDWMAMALFAKNRRKFAIMCGRAEKAKNTEYRQAAVWLNRLMKSNEDKASK
ncbi:MAG: hypothetical protein AAFV33_24015 [Chloroflexota bacterium]